MASLEKVEGDAVEAVGLVLLVALAYIAYVLYKSLNRIPTWEELMGKIKELINKFLSGQGGNIFGPGYDHTASDGADSTGEGGDGAGVRTGSDMPVVDDQTIIDEMRASGQSEEYIAQFIAANGLVGE